MTPTLSGYYWVRLTPGAAVDIARIDMVSASSQPQIRMIGLRPTWGKELERMYPDAVWSERLDPQELDDEP